MSTTLTSYPTIPSSWTAPTSCFATTNYYRVLYGSDFFSNMYGTPTPVFSGNAPSGDCFPPSFTINVPYITHGGCPKGYTLACATEGPTSNGQPVSTLTCCPSVTWDVFSFMCKDNQYGCHATATSGVTWTGTLTEILVPTPTEEPITRAPYLDEGCEAWGIKLISVAALSTSTPAPTSHKAAPAITSPPKTTSIPQPTQTNQPSAGPALSTGAIVGVSIGAFSGVLILLLVAFFLYRRRHSKSNEPPAYQTQQADALPPKPWDQYGQSRYSVPAQQGPYQLDGGHMPQRPLRQPQGHIPTQPSPQPLWELDGESYM